MSGNFRINQDPQMFLQSDVRAFLVYAGQAAITSNIGCENGREPSKNILPLMRGALTPAGPKSQPCVERLRYSYENGSPI